MLAALADNYCGGYALLLDERLINERGERFRAPLRTDADPLAYFVKQVSTYRFVLSPRFT